MLSECEGTLDFLSLRRIVRDWQRSSPTATARNMLDGKVIGRNMQRHRHQEFIRFLNADEREVPKGKAIHVILDKSMVRRPSIPLCEAGVGSKPTTGAVHKHPKVKAWFARHSRWTFHFTPTFASWLNAVEGFFAKLSRRKLKCGVFHSVAALQTAINDFVAQHNQSSGPFVWRANPKDMIAAIKRAHQHMETIH